MLDTMTPSYKLVQAFERAEPLTDQARTALLGLPCSVRSRTAGSYLSREGDVSDLCGILLSGFAYRHKVTNAGARQIVSILISGEMIDIQHLFLDPADHNVQALTNIEVGLVSRDALRDLARAIPSIASSIATQLAIDASSYREWVMNAGRRDARARVGHLLCELAVRFGTYSTAAKRCFELPLTQEQIGDAVGLTPIHVNRVMRTLEKEGLLIRLRRSITVPHWEALRHASDFDSRYLHLDRAAADRLARV